MQKRFKKMKNQIEIIEEISKLQVKSIICNCCGKKIELVHEYNITDINNIIIEFGYGSRFDLSAWEIDICDDCIEKWIQSFKHPIIMHELNFA